MKRVLLILAMVLVLAGCNENSTQPKNVYADYIKNHLSGLWEIDSLPYGKDAWRFESSQYFEDWIVIKTASNLREFDGGIKYFSEDTLIADICFNSGDIHYGCGMTLVFVDAKTFKAKIGSQIIIFGKLIK